MGALSNYPGARGGLRGASTGPVVPGVGVQVRGGGRDEARHLCGGGEGRAGRARRAEQASGGSSSFVAGRAKIFPPHSSNKRWADRGQGFPGGNTVGVSTMESRAVTSEVAYAPELASKPVSWNQPGSPDRLSRTAAPRERRPHHGNTVGA